MSVLDLDKANFGDIQDLLESIIDTAADRGVDFGEPHQLSIRFNISEPARMLSQKEVKKASKVIDVYGSLIDDQVWKRVADRIRQRKHREKLSRDGTKIPRIPISEETKAILDKIKLELSVADNGKRISYDQAIRSLLSKRDKKKKSKRAK